MNTLKIIPLKEHWTKSHLIDLIGRLIHGQLNIRELILVFGSPRSGTTWIMEILETLPGYKSIFEPFHKDWFLEVKNLILILPDPTYTIKNSPHNLKNT